MRKNVICAIAMLFLGFANISGNKTALWAQNPNYEGVASGKIIGKVLDATTQQPVEYATIALYSAKDTVLQGGATTDSFGSFTVEGVKPGMYQLRVNFIGYEAKEIANIQLIPKKDNMLHNVGTVLLKEAAIALQSVEIAGQRSAMTQHIDKQVYNVEKLSATAGGNAVDVLQNIPSMQIDQDGRLSMRGSGNVNILINGRPSTLTGNGTQDFLEQLPANTIESIELITNPSAKYDPEGVSGILNIVLKKNKVSGFNGNVNLGAGTNDKYNGGVQLNYRSGKWNFFSNYNFKLERFNTNGESQRSDFVALQPDSLLMKLDQTSEGFSRPLSHLFRLGADFALDNRNSFSLSGGYNFSKRDNYDTTINYLEDFKESTSSSFDRFGNADSDSQGWDGNFFYKHDFRRQGQNFTLDLTYSTTRNDISRLYTSSYIESIQLPQIDKNEDSRKNSLAIIQADFIQPLTEVNRLELGYKTTFRNVDNLFNAFTYDNATNTFVPDTLANHYLYDENFNAVYGTYVHRIGKFNLQAGLRVEQTSAHAKLEQGDQPPYDANYISLFPSVNFTYAPSDKHQWRWSYSRRINRPSLEALFPFADYSDRYNLFAGNPFLRPEFIHSLETNYTTYLKSFSIAPTVYFRYAPNSIQRVKIVQNGIGQVLQLNLNSNTTAGLDVALNGTLAKWWNITLNNSFFYEHLDGTNIQEGWTTNSLNFSTRLISGWTISKKVDVQFSGFYRTPMRRPQGKIQPMYSFDAAVNFKLFRNNQGLLTFRLSDIFDTRIFRIDLNDYNYSQSFYRKRESRIGFINFSYRFGKLEQKKGKAQSNRNANEVQQGGGGDVF